MSITSNNNDLSYEINMLFFGDVLDYVNIVKQHILKHRGNFKIDVVVEKDSLFQTLETGKHSILIFFDFKHENNLNEVELFVKEANPDIKLLFLDYSSDQLFEPNNNPELDAFITKVLLWIEIILEKNVPSDFLSVKLSPKKIFNEDFFPVTNVFEKNNGEDQSYRTLLNELKRLKTIFDLAPEGIAILNMRGYITQVNKAWCELTGYDYDEMVGKHLLRTGIIKSDEILKMSKVVSAILRGKPVESFEFKGYKKDGTWRIGSSRSRLIDLGFFKKEIVLLTHDVTDRYLKEMKLKSTLNDLAITNRELDDYSYAVSHDLKAPLRTIKSFGTFLLEDYSDKLDEEGQMYLNRMMDATTHMKDLIDDLLTISRVGRLDVEDELIDINEVIDLIRLDLNSQLEDTNGEIISTVLPKILGKRIWLRQLFFNLISNGLKFNKSKEPKIWINNQETASEYIFSVRDNGIGIEEKHYEKIFKIFERLHKQEEYSGTGAGLTICKKIVDNLDGRIWLKSKMGEGTTFYFSLPKDTKNQLDTSLGESYTIAEINIGSNYPI